MNYKDPRWQKFRLKRLESANWKCVKCGNANSTLHIHHTFYAAGREPWEYPPESTLVLCEVCHKAIHAVGEEFLSSGMSNSSEWFIRDDDLRHDDSKDEFEEWIYVEDGKRITVRRRNPNYKPAEEITPASMITPTSKDRGAAE